MSLLFTDIFISYILFMGRRYDGLLPSIENRSQLLDVCYNFVYQPCVTVSVLKVPLLLVFINYQGVELVMRYFVGTEVGVSNTLQRHFDVSELIVCRSILIHLQWSANSLFFEEIPDGHDHRKVTFFLAGKDAILDAKVCISPTRIFHYK